LIVFYILLFLPSAAAAQAVITGVVKDSSGSVLPGVTVEAASPVLIEKLRSVVSDDTGQYRIVSLPPGTYTITFTLPGFSTVKRDGIELTGTFVATVNADLKVGALEETITVIGETPVVDVQSAKVQQSVSKEVLAAIPTSRTATGIQALIPGLNTGTNAGGISGGSEGGAGTIHGGNSADSRMLNDGLTTGYNNTGGGGGNNANVAGSQEVVITTSGGLAEAETAGVQINLIPREGGNTFSGTVAGAGATGGMQGSNYSQALQTKGLPAPQQLKNVYDLNPMGGGRIVRNRLWFYATYRVWGAHNTVPGIFWNSNAGDPTKWTLAFDQSRPAIADVVNSTLIGRLTWQATPRNKLGMFWNEQYNCIACSGGGVANPPATIEAASGRQVYKPSRVRQVSWSSPISSKLLAEAGWGEYSALFSFSGQPRTDGTYNPDLIQVQEQAGVLPNVLYRAPQRYDRSAIGTQSWRASISYVTGAHNMKFGYYGGLFNPTYYWYQPRNDGILQYRFLNGVPNQILFTGSNPSTQYRTSLPTSLYAQDQWTVSRLTLQGGVRFDRQYTYYPENQFGGTAVFPVPVVFPEKSTPGVNLKDLTPRLGAAYNVFGNGKTAVKFNLGKYASAIPSIGGDLDANPIIRMGSGLSGNLSDANSRSWKDLNQNYIPDCDLSNFADNRECGPVVNQSYGKGFVQNFDPNVLQGWGVRPYEWDLGLSVQQELVPRVSLTVAYNRRWFGNFLVDDNVLIGPSDFDPFSVPVAADPRLPNGGGNTITGLYDLNPAKFGQVSFLRTPASKLGQESQNWQGVDVGVVARLRNGITVQGGTSTGRTLTDYCAVGSTTPVVAAVGTAGTAGLVNVDNPSRRFCRVVEPLLTQVRGLATYTIPRVDLLVSATWSSIPGPQLAANWFVPNAVVQSSLNRPLSGGAAGVTVNLVQPGTLYGDRINDLDFRVAKVLRLGRTRTQVGIDLYNILNNDVVTGYNSGYVPGGSWLKPTAILPARYMKVTGQIDF
jgi:hypothetical protein